MAYCSSPFARFNPFVYAAAFTFFDRLPTCVADVLLSAGGHGACVMIHAVAEVTVEDVETKEAFFTFAGGFRKRGSGAHIVLGRQVSVFTASDVSGFLGLAFPFTHPYSGPAAR